MEIVCRVAEPRARVLVIHSWWGLTRSFRDYAERLADAGFAVGLSDLFDGRTARTEDEARRLRAMPRKLPMYRTLIADIHALMASGPAPATQVSLVGFSMGGHWAVWLSRQPELPVRSTVLYYAARGGDFSECRASILAHFAQDDPWVSASARRGMERALARAQCRYRAHDYPGTGHWFAEADRPEAYDKAAADLALERTIAHMRQPP